MLLVARVSSKGSACRRSKEHRKERQQESTRDVRCKKLQFGYLISIKGMDMIDGSTKASLALLRQGIRGTTRGRLAVGQKVP